MRERLNDDVYVRERLNDDVFRISIDYILELLARFARSPTSDVLEHKWRASLKTILFLYDFDF